MKDQKIGNTPINLQTNYTSIFTHLEPACFRYNSRVSARPFFVIIIIVIRKFPFYKKYIFLCVETFLNVQRHLAHYVALRLFVK